MEMGVLSNVKLFLFDLDGCVYYNNKPARDAAELLTYLNKSGYQYGFVTNNSRQNAHEIALKLNAMGIPAKSKQIFTVTDHIGLFVKSRFGSVTIKTAGSISMDVALRTNGHTVIPLNDPIKADVIVIGRDTEFDYTKLSLIAQEVERGAVVIGGNIDDYHPGSMQERVPETGAILAAVRAVIGQEIRCVGKPDPFLFHCSIKRFGVPAEYSVMIGDNLETDIAGGINAGMKTVWIRNGKKDPKESGKRYHDLSMEDLSGLYRYLLDS